VKLCISRRHLNCEVVTILSHHALMSTGRSVQGKINSRGMPGVVKSPTFMREKVFRLDFQSRAKVSVFEFVVGISLTVSCQKPGYASALPNSIQSTDFGHCDFKPKHHNGHGRSDILGIVIDDGVSNNPDTKRNRQPDRYVTRQASLRCPQYDGLDPLSR